MTEKNFTLTQEYLKEVLHYNPDTGVFIWLSRPHYHFKTRAAYNSWVNCCFDKAAGTISKTLSGKCYRRITIKNKIYGAHRLAFLYMEGEFPLFQVDHEDGNGLNNRWNNINLATRFDNSKNMRLPSNNTTGCIGVYWRKDRQKWKCKIQVDGKIIELGTYGSLLDAASVRISAEKKYGFHKNHGSNRPL